MSELRASVDRVLQRAHRVVAALLDRQQLALDERAGRRCPACRGRPGTCAGRGPRPLPARPAPPSRRTPWRRPRPAWRSRPTAPSSSAGLPPSWAMRLRSFAARSWCDWLFCSSCGRSEASVDLLHRLAVGLHRRELAAQKAVEGVARSSRCSRRIPALFCSIAMFVPPLRPTMGSAPPAHNRHCPLCGARCSGSRWPRGCAGATPAATATARVSIASASRARSGSLMLSRNQRE